MSPAQQPGALWLALQFPHLALDLASRGDPRYRKRPLAISDGNQRGQHVYDCNPPAARAGIRAGMPVNAALGLLGGLQLKAREPQAEQQALERLAAWCYQYSSQVCLLPGRTALVLEAGASRRLFGAAETLSRDLDAALLRMGYHARSGSAPTPEAAQLAARHGLHLAQAAELRRDLGRLPLDSLYLPPAQREALAKTGFSTIGEILRLPRKALARRMGPATVTYLDRLTGSRPTPVKAWQPPAHFSATLDLAPEITGSQALLFPLRRLVSELCGTLRGNDCGIQ
ncbi:MAG: DNA polymerase Y family protein, partial [Xanthomonadales bacterium]|nr:DNA polymerase Y family protein [Xanthomonadales bacterium]